MRKKPNRKLIEKAQAKAFEDLLDKSIKGLKKNSKAMERAIKKVLDDEGIKVSQEEYLEVQALTNTLNAIDSVINKLVGEE